MEVEKQADKQAEEAAVVAFESPAGESAAWTALWQQLSVCLTAIGNDVEDPAAVTLLLPLIEAFMVTAKHAAIDATKSGAPSLATARFLAFTRAHRKLLNLMVKNTPSLMSGSFAILVHNPQVLDFENKRAYFTQRLHKRGQRDHYGTLQVNVRRQYVFEDSFQSLSPARRSADQIKYGKLSVRCQSLLDLIRSVPALICLSSL